MAQNAHRSDASADRPPPDAEVLAEIAAPARGRRWRWLLAAGILLAVVAVVVLWSQGRGEATFETAVVERGPLESHVIAVGQVEPLESVEIGSELSGTVAEVLVEVNDRVQKDQVLARLEATDVQSALAQAQAQVDIARAGLTQARVQAEQARTERDRTGRLLARGAATAAEMQSQSVAAEAAEAQVASAAAQLQQARASLEQAQQNLGDAEIRSPIDGVVIQRLVDPGQTVVSALQATALFEVASDLSAMKAEVSVDEADVGRVQIGQPARFTVAAWPDRTFEATVSTVDLAPDPAATVVSYLAELRIENPDLALRPGMTATAEIRVGRLEDVLLVPAAALRFNPPDATPPSGDHVWRLGGEGEAPVAVSVAVLGTEGARTAVESPDLQVGQTVLIGVGGPGAGPEGQP